MNDSGWRLYIPPLRVDNRPKDFLWPCPITETPLEAERLVVVVSLAADLAAVRSLLEEASPGAASKMVLWAWFLPEQVALEAEGLLPVVYGLPTTFGLDEALEKGTQVSEVTQALATLEQAVGFDPMFSMPALG